MAKRLTPKQKKALARARRREEDTGCGMYVSSSFRKHSLHPNTARSLIRRGLLEWRVEQVVLDSWPPGVSGGVPYGLFVTDDA